MHSIVLISQLLKSTTFLINKKMKNKIISFLLCLTIPFALNSCGSKTAKEETQSEEHEHHGEISEVTITQKQFDAIKVQLGTIEQKNLTNT